MEQVDNRVGNHLLSAKLSETLFRFDLVINYKECSRFCLKCETDRAKMRRGNDHVLGTSKRFYLDL